MEIAARLHMKRIALIVDRKQSPRRFTGMTKVELRRMSRRPLNTHTPLRFLARPGRK